MWDKRLYHFHYNLRARYRTAIFTGGRNGIIIEIPRGVGEHAALAIHRELEAYKRIEIHVGTILRDKIKQIGANWAYD